MTFWKILRVLTTNQCNHKCIYCHNEGQQAINNIQLTYDKFVEIMNYLRLSDFQEIRFSGGEPLCNIDTIRMIEWVNEHTEWEVGLATNASLITEELAERLGKTRVMLTVHLPGIANEEYFNVTKVNDQKDFFNNINFLDKYKVNYSFNFVLYPEVIDNLSKILKYVVSKGGRIKLLPFLDNKFSNYSEKSMETVKKLLEKEQAEYFFDEQKGIIWWYFSNGATVKLIESPCYTSKFLHCKEYGEVRLLPDVSLQTCIFGKSHKITNTAEILSVFQMLWNNFNSCIGR